MMRVDVFSAKGGVGKTTVAFRLARSWTKKSKLPVLLIDADLAGTCLGELLEPDAAWKEEQNLIHLVCGIPEELPENLGLDRLPVYELRPTPAETPLRVCATTGGESILFCPSHAETDLPVAEPAVLHALLGHESAGGWVSHVIERVIGATKKRVPSVVAAIVDHGPGIGALQWAQMCAIEKELANACGETRSSTRQALFVASRDLVDLAAVRAIDDRITPPNVRNLPHLRANALWVLNRLPQAWNLSGNVAREAWRTSLKDALKETSMSAIVTSSWFRRAFPVFEDPGLASAYAESKLVTYMSTGDEDDIAAILDELTRNIVPRAAP